jgi:glycolate oxidase FAD binding subunit
VSLDDAVAQFATAVGTDGPVTISGAGTRGGPVAGVRCVTAPTGIEWVQPAEMTIRCGAGTTIAEVDAALAEFGQCVAVPEGGTLGGALAVGHSDVRRLGWGPVRDTVLQVRYVSAHGEVVKVGGPTVKNVSGFDLCRLLVGSRGTLGLLSDVILRTRPRPVDEQWFTSVRNPWQLQTELYRPTSILWDGVTTWVLLDGHPDDVQRQVEASRLRPTDGPPELPEHRWSMAPASLHTLRSDQAGTGEAGTDEAGTDEAGAGTFVAEIGVGIVHHTHRQVRPTPNREAAELHRRIKFEFDPNGRLNPGVDVLAGR